MIKTSYIAKMVNGKPQIFATTQKDNGAPVYIFTEKETFDAAIENHLIPVGALIVKTYDAVEMAGGPFDAALSDESENAVQNKVVKSAIDSILSDQKVYRAEDVLRFQGNLTLYTEQQYSNVSINGIIVNINISIVGDIILSDATDGVIEICKLPGKLNPTGAAIYEAFDHEGNRYQIRTIEGGDGTGSLVMFFVYAEKRNVFIPINITYARKIK